MGQLDMLAGAATHTGEGSCPFHEYATLHTHAAVP